MNTFNACAYVVNGKQGLEVFPFPTSNLADYDKKMRRSVAKYKETGTAYYSGNGDQPSQVTKWLAGMVQGNDWSPVTLVTLEQDIFRVDDFTGKAGKKNSSPHHKALTASRKYIKDVVAPRLQAMGMTNPIAQESRHESMRALDYYRQQMQSAGVGVPSGAAKALHDFAYWTSEEALKTGHAVQGMDEGGQSAFDLAGHAELRLHVPGQGLVHELLLQLLRDVMGLLGIGLGEQDRGQDTLLLSFSPEAENRMSGVGDISLALLDGQSKECSVMVRKGRKFSDDALLVSRMSSIVPMLETYLKVALRARDLEMTARPSLLSTALQQVAPPYKDSRGWAGRLRTPIQNDKEGHAWKPTDYSQGCSNHLLPKEDIWGFPISWLKYQDTVTVSEHLVRWNELLRKNNEHLR